MSSARSARVVERLEVHAALPRQLLALALGHLAAGARLHPLEGLIERTSRHLLAHPPVQPVRVTLARQIELCIERIQAVVTPRPVAQAAHPNLAKQRHQSAFTRSPTVRAQHRIAASNRAASYLFARSQIQVALQEPAQQLGALARQIRLHLPVLELRGLLRLQMAHEHCELLSRQHELIARRDDLVCLSHQGVLRLVDIGLATSYLPSGAP